MGILGIIFRAIVYIAMIIGGAALNYYIDSPILVAVIMFVISFLMNRGGGTQKKIVQKEAPKHPSVGYTFCSNCGYKAKKGTHFCASCGASLAGKPGPPISPIETYSAPEILDQITTLNRRFQSGQLDERTYTNILNKSMFKDGWNRIWAVGVNTLQWYRYNDGQWVKDTPTGNLSFK